MQDSEKTKKQLIDELAELRKQTETSLRRSEEKFARAFHCSPNAITISTLKEGRYVEVNDAYLASTGYKRHEVLGRSSCDLGIWIMPEAREDILKRIQANEGTRNLEMNFRIKSGEIRTFLFSAELLDIDGEAHLLTISHDISERKQADEDIKYLSFHDRLTGVYNRAFFEEQLKRIDVKREYPISLIMGDVNGLKLINEAVGSGEGDKMLKTVADIFEKSCRQGDYVARWGGDEFVILLSGCDKNNAKKVMTRIKNACKQSHELPIQVSISLGLASKNSSTRDMQEVIKEAEDKMYRNKLLASNSARSSFINSLENTLWTRSHETKEHCHRMLKLAKKIARAIGLSDSETDSLKLMATLHDIGKIAIPNSILDKPGKLSIDEWEYIKKHPEIGYHIALSSPELASIAEGILNHHERWDGNGYPRGNKGSSIPLISRIIAVIDTYDVMINGRPYQKPFAQEEVLAEISRCAGTQFDPEVAGLFVSLF
ncbi:MAG: diguanylate cyclase [Syntrophomonadaceae bacterium]|nr:diguanylate cyclase [Syntrophomonadaceae bacterium]MDD3024069.1 diguanylate cyclase [Syntrophomonadaceae bacterium]